MLRLGTAASRARSLARISWPIQPLPTGADCFSDAVDASAVLRALTIDCAAANDRFALRAAAAEAAFHAPGVGYNGASGFTYDGHGIDYASGGLAPGTLHEFSAPSKVRVCACVCGAHCAIVMSSDMQESIHVALLAAAVNGSDVALTFVGGRATALALLATKMTTCARGGVRAWGCCCVAVVLSRFCHCCCCRCCY
jgi:hypothetical protein